MVKFMSKFEEYQKAIDELVTRQIKSHKGWNPGFQIIIDKLRQGQMNLALKEANKQA